MCLGSLFALSMAACAVSPEDFADATLAEFKETDQIEKILLESSEEEGDINFSDEEKKKFVQALCAFEYEIKGVSEQEDKAEVNVTIKTKNFAKAFEEEFTSGYAGLMTRYLTDAFSGKEFDEQALNKEVEEIMHDATVATFEKADEPYETEVVMVLSKNDKGDYDLPDEENSELMNALTGGLMQLLGGDNIEQVTDEVAKDSFDEAAKKNK